MKKLFYLAFVFVSILFLSSCNKANNKEIEGFKFNDYEGEKIVEYNPTNVALLYPSYADMWLSTGGDISIGVEDLITRGYTDSNITLVGDGTGKTINLEKLVKSNPGFVILSHDFPNHDSYAKSLKEFNIPYAIFEYSSYDDYLNILEIFSNINKSDAYNKYGVEQQKEINDIIDKSKLESPKKVLILRALSTKVTALTSSNFVGEMVNNLNSINIADSNKEISSDLSIEVILKCDPDIILIVPMGDEEIAFNNADKLLSDSLWQSLTAVKENRVYRMEKDLFHYKPNIKWGEAYEILYQRIYK